MDYTNLAQDGSNLLRHHASVVFDTIV